MAHEKSQFSALQWVGVIALLGKVMSVTASHYDITRLYTACIVM